ncbi:hypothetical protein DFJ73DRAFT_847482 [Zopfochytrium polystomum]|nr:hypothetical protein DFJ73DRAFT_847482 [Zopfochytrium polystomum]
MRKFNHQDYERLFTEHARSRKKFIDDAFPPNDSSLFLPPSRRPASPLSSAGGSSEAAAVLSTSSHQIVQPQSDIVWIRASELAAEPYLFAGRRISANIIPGAVGDCWVVSAAAALTIHPSLIARVVPNVADQDWVNDVDARKRGSYYTGYYKSPDIHPGIFLFRFFRFGEWVDVVIDDYLPCTAQGELVYSRSRNPQEFWVSLLEKAYAKLNGCYEALEYCSPTSAFVDLSGNVPEQIDLRSPEAMAEFKEFSLFDMMLKEMKRETLMSCSMQPTAELANGGENELGLIYGYSYAITNVVRVNLRMSNMRRRTVCLIKLHNPWVEYGGGKYTGAWGEWSDEWQLVTKRELQRLNLAADNDEAFFMSMEDFLKHFTMLTVCRQQAAPRTRLGGPRMWQFYASWSIPGRTAGGCINHPETFPLNPQFLVHMQHAGQLMISLIQRDPATFPSKHNSQSIPVKPVPTAAEPEQPVYRSIFSAGPILSLVGWSSGSSSKQASDKSSNFDAISANNSKATGLTNQQSIAANSLSNYLTVGFVVLRVEENRKYRVHTSTYEVVFMMTYVNAREVFGRCRLGPGRYVIVPTTFTPGEEGDFLIRVASTVSKAIVSPLSKDLPTRARGLQRLFYVAEKRLRPVQHWQHPPLEGSPRSTTSSSARPGFSATSLPSLPSSLTGHRPYPIGVFRIEIVQCTNLARQKIWRAGADAYCILRFTDPPLKTPPRWARTRWQPPTRADSAVELQPANPDVSWLRLPSLSFSGGNTQAPAAPTPLMHIGPPPNTPATPRRKSPRTVTIPNTLNPVFRSAYMFPVRSPRDAWLQIEVWNRYFSPLPALDRFLGCAVVRLEDYMEGGRAGRVWEVDLGLRPMPAGSSGVSTGVGVGPGGTGVGDVQGAVRVRVKYEGSLDYL